MTVLVQVLIIFGVISMFASLLVLSACVLSGKVSDVGRVPVVDTELGDIGSEGDSENVYA